MSQHRLLALDVGERRIGVAMSDPSGSIASPHSTVVRKDGRKGTLEAVRQLADLIRAMEVGEVIVGRPLRTDGTPGAQEAKVKEFVDLLEKQVPARIVRVDERFSTVQANNMLLAADVSRAGRKQVVDKVAAAILLQQYLDCRQANAERRNAKGLDREEASRE